MRMLFVLQEFGQKIKHWTSNNLDLIMMLCKKPGVAKVITIHLKGDMNVGTNFDNNPSNSCCDISAWTKAVDRPISKQANIATERAPFLKSAK